VQQVATAHWQATAGEAHRDCYIWVVTRHEIDYLRPAFEGDRVTARSWIGGPPKGARCDRLVEFTGNDGRLCVRARTSWAIVDRATGRAVRVPAAVIAPFIGQPGDGAHRPGGERF